MSASLAWKNVFHHKGKLILSVLSIGASLAMVLLLLGFREGLYAALTAYVNNLDVDLIATQSGNEGVVSANSVLPGGIHNELEELADAREAGHIAVAGVIFTSEEDKSPIVLVGYEPDSGLGDPWNLGAGRYSEQDDEILLDTWLAQRSRIQIGDTVELLGRKFEVVGLTRGTTSWMASYVFVTLPAAQEALGLEDSVSYHLLRLNDRTNLEAAKAAIESRFPNVKALEPDQIADTDRRTVAAVMDRPINILLFVAVIIGVAVMALTSYTSITDRLREYGLLKAVGARPLRLVIVVVQENLLSSSLGIVTGVALAYLSAALIIANWPQFNVTILPESVWNIAVLGLIMTLVAAMLPIRRLDRIDVLDVFKA
ncbi:MAG: FtsX-like permease family protein [Anaerolineales bacterium]